MRYIRLFLAVSVIAVCFTSIGSSGTWMGSFSASVLAEGAKRTKRDIAFERVYIGCVSCHDGTTGSDVSIEKIVSERKAGWSAASRDHPVGMKYSESYLKKVGSMVPLHSLPATIVMVDGKVTCLSCHKLEESVRRSIDRDSEVTLSSVACTSSKEITVKEWRQNLCVSCHIK